MKKILILTGRYLPGHKDGGPLRTIINITDALGDEYDFYIGCLDRDHGDQYAYTGIIRNEWNQVGKAKVWYVEPGGFTNELLMKLIEGKDLLYLTSFYSDFGYKSLLLKRCGKITIPVALASMGVFSPAALAHKALKKKFFIFACKALHLFRNITWSVTSELEANDLKNCIGNDISYIVAEDLPRINVPGRLSKRNEKFQIVFLSRICAHKGLDIAIDALQHIDIDKFCFSIYGPIQEANYWNKCVNKLKSSKINWTYEGDVASELVQEVLSHYDVLILPTKSENYGHVIFEALSVGCIPVISDTTPWSVVKTSGAGKVLSLDDISAFSLAIESLINSPKEEINNMRKQCVELALDTVNRSINNTGYRLIFEESFDNGKVEH